MYFVILGKHRTISLTELQFVQPTNIRHQGNIATFDTVYPDRIRLLGGIIKRGTIIASSQLSRHLTSTSLIGTNDPDLATKLKRDLEIKRYKILDVDHCDRDIIRGGQEILLLPKSLIGEGSEPMIGYIDMTHGGYQQIALYETIDYDKPLKGMSVGMMPSKLAHVLINIALCQQTTAPIPKPIIYDPFCGFGTTNRVANALGYDTMGTDKIITSAKQNRTRWDTTSLKTDHRILLDKHDVTTPYTIKPLRHATHIVTEGRLGPIVTQQRVGERLAHDNQTLVLNVYKQRLTHTADYRPHIIIVTTVPYYLDHPVNILSPELTTHATSLGFTVSTLPEVYSRPGQKVGRQIMIIQK